MLEKLRHINLFFLIVILVWRQKVDPVLNFFLRICFLLSAALISENVV